MAAGSKTTGAHGVNRSELGLTAIFKRLDSAIAGVDGIQRVVDLFDRPLPPLAVTSAEHEQCDR
ncbi:MAG: hypothetical protein K0M66_01695 [Thiobacillus sp.]|nr:hypothetical protein [Thiobacillus sp.]